MQGASLVLTSYQDSLRQAMDIVANNVANLNTTGFKRETASFDSFLIRPTPTDSFNFAVDSGTYRDSAQGATLVTGNPLDVAIQGGAYFSVQTPAGVRYTRAGAFQINNEGEIVNGSGDRLLGDGGQPLVLPSDARDILIGPDGTVTAQTGNSVAATQIGRISLVRFSSDQVLQPVGNNLYTSTTTPEPDVDSRVVQGSIEQSNVQAIAEMTRMIEISRSYQMVVHMLEKESERQTSAIQRLGKATA